MMVVKFQEKIFKVHCLPDSELLVKVVGSGFPIGKWSEEFDFDAMKDNCIGLNRKVNVSSPQVLKFF